MEERPVWLEPRVWEKKCEAQLKMWQRPDPDFAGHAKDLGFDCKYIKKALEIF